MKLGKKKNNELSSFLNSANMRFDLNGTLSLIKKIIIKLYLIKIKFYMLKI